MHTPVAYLPTDEHGSTLGFMLCRDCNHEAELSGHYDEAYCGSLALFSWEMSDDDTCDHCHELIADTL